MVGDELKEALKDVHVIGIRSKTKLTAEVINAAPKLIAIGCFCIGTNQVDLKAAAARGIPVFNSPYANSRSVAELIISQIVSLARQLGDRNREIHEGNWNKVSAECYEIRGKTLGIVGYGHIGSQVSVLAESMGMRVKFYDIVPKLALGNASQSGTLQELFEEADFVTLHVPATSETAYMITKVEIAWMKPKSYLLNASRGNVVVIEDLAAALKSGALSGAYVDVFPTEPKGNGNGFETPLRGLKNVLLTPHIGGSTEEAQAAIGVEVASKLMRYTNSGTTTDAVNFPQCDLPYLEVTHRICNVHRNVPGVLKKINDVLGDYNVSGQALGTKDGIGYLMVQVDSKFSETIKQKVMEVDESIRTRVMW
ncbi:D-3-phosphoglycerate dehydrogenase [Sphaeroforma arctica JP610]|uniref:D-3-phosphoglycerate dehydrogenase n=1 Tax=Sphaeroforma arctica JP610 TaxID=667725 RepID=A0A0L0FDX8_9EUKA|nr:D-3-phosphoglycerate dehydrogenase [Sphaeroforma arctica JP610]KNC74661.1 D-3-phosphoglycerate dehydrogenase [Sphaeroforma arctica JP610]|eukprot:XP_014148563.1 D-3-phosphoglycerate dehydrogenase [Sphaeroforma arctica JP610]